MPRKPDPNLAEPPLRPVVFAVLLALSEERLHGYAIMKAANERLGSRVIVGPGTLYRTLKELRDQGLIEHTATPDGEDPRRQYYRIAAAGKRAAAAEARRMSGLVDEARARQLIPDARGEA